MLGLSKSIIFLVHVAPEMMPLTFILTLTKLSKPL